MDLDEDDKLNLVENLQIKHNEAEAAKLAEHQAAEAHRRAAYDQAELERKNSHFQRLGQEYVAYQEAASSSRATRSGPLAPFAPAPYVAAPAFEPTAFVPTPFVPPAIISKSFEYIEVQPGNFMKVPKMQTKEVQMTLGEAMSGLDHKIYSSIEADEIFKKYSKEMTEFNKHTKSKETDEMNYLNTLWSALTDASKAAMAEKLNGGKVALEELYTNKRHEAILDLIYDTHSNDNLYRSCSPQDKQAFIAAELNYLSPDKMKQRTGESVINYVERFKKFFDLSLQLKSLCGDDWKHEEVTWIHNVVSYSNAPSLTPYKSALFNTDPLRGALDIQYKKTFIAQCEELIKMSQEASIGKLLAGSNQKRSRSNKTSGQKSKRSKAEDTAPSDQVAMKTSVEEQPGSSDPNPVRHYIDVKKIPDKVLRALVRERKDEIDKLMKSDTADVASSQKRPYGKRDQKKTSKKKKATPHNKSKSKTDNPSKPVRHTDYESSDRSSDSSEGGDSSDSDSDDDESEGYATHFTISSLKKLECCHDIAPNCCRGQCCFHTRRPKKNFRFSKAPKDNFSAGRLGMLAIDTASSVNVCSEEHAGDEPILPLRRPIRLKGVQGMKSVITHYFIHQIFGLCLLGNTASILSYGMLTAMGFKVIKANENVISLKHPKLKGVAPIVFHRTSDKLFVASDPTLVKTWQRLTGKDRVGHFRSVVNSKNESKQEYKISFDEGDVYSDKGVYAVQVEASDADEVLSQIVSDLAQPALSTEVEGRLGGVEGCSPQSN
jgi:hypothetical protein